MHFLRRVTAALMTFCFLTTSSFAEITKSGGQHRMPAQKFPQQQASEYFLGHAEGEILIPINVVGAVNKAGLYYVPRNTDIYRLVAAAGGFRPDADITTVSVKRRSSDKESVVWLNLKDSLKTAESTRFVLEAEDVVHISPAEPIISQYSLSLLTITASILSIILTATVIRKNM